MLGVAVVAVLRDGIGRGAPAVDGGCDSPGFSLSRDEVGPGDVVKWSVAGPSGAEVVISPSDAADDPRRLLGPVRIGSGCKASGRFGVLLPEGTYTLHVILLRDGATQEIGTHQLEVNAPY